MTDILQKPPHEDRVKIWKFAFDYDTLPLLVPELPLPDIKYLGLYLQADGISCTWQKEVYSHQPSTFDTHILKSLDPNQISVDDNVDAIDPGENTIGTGVNLRDLQTQHYCSSLRNKFQEIQTQTPTRKTTSLGTNTHSTPATTTGPWRKNCVFLLGDGGAWFGNVKVSKSLKGSRTAPMQKFWRQVRLHPWVKGVAMVNEWGTSKTCCGLR
ncbi:hypothetical protein BJ741DRAFT_682670 [Chytriomyces cf. hyalinus JEL632]|nr:hypothetical protein BJ741DRAFT_682670 [Chytriomyces cf. hyalinus JEL632]